MSVVLATLRRELKRSSRSHADMLQPLLFYVLTIAMFPFALGTDEALLGAAAAGIVWITTVLAVTLSLDALFRADYTDGSLEILYANGMSLGAYGLGKTLGHWLLTGVPTLLLAAPAAAALALPGDAIPVLLMSLLLGSLTMSLLGTAISALTVGLKSSGLLLAMLILPLYIPVLIFGAAATSSHLHGGSAAAELYFLAGVFILALSLSPWATAAALRIRVS